MASGGNNRNVLYLDPLEFLMLWGCLPLPKHREQGEGKTSRCADVRHGASTDSCRDDPGAAAQLPQDEPRVDSAESSGQSQPLTMLVNIAGTTCEWEYVVDPQAESQDRSIEFHRIALFWYVRESGLKYISLWQLCL